MFKYTADADHWRIIKYEAGLLTAGCAAARLSVQVDGVCWNQMLVSILQSQNSSDGFLERHRNISRIFSAGLEVRVSSAFPAPLLSFLAGHLPLRHVHLVSQKHEGEAVGLLDVGVEDELLPPVVEVVEALAVVHAEGEQAAVGAAVEGRPQAPESLLTRRVPDLQRDRAAVHLQVFIEELHADGVEEMGVELVCDVAVHERALSHSTVAQENDFKKR